MSCNDFLVVRQIRGADRHEHPLDHARPAADVIERAAGPAPGHRRAGTEPGPGEVLIRVTAAGINFVDVSQARGTFAGGPQPPYLAGIEGVGEVAAVGEGVSDLEPGAHVIGVAVSGGAFAEYMVLPAAAAVPVPAGWADEEALGLVVNWPTALAALKPLGGVPQGRPC